MLCQQLTFHLKIHMPKPANRTQSNRQLRWLATAAVLVCAFAVALLLFAVAPDADRRELSAQGGDPPQTVIPPPPVRTIVPPPPPTDGQRTILPPVSPDFPTGSVTGVGSVALDWNDVPGADSYMVGLWTINFWSRLPWNDVTVQYSGSSAQIDNLPNYDIYNLRIRAINSAGNSRWSGFAVIENDTSNLPTATPIPTATPDAAPTATPTATVTLAATTTPMATPTPTATATATATATSIATPTPTATVGTIIDPLPGSCHDLVTAPSRRSTAVCYYPKMQNSLMWRVCEYEAAQGQSGDGVSEGRSSEPIPRVSVHVDLVAGTDPQEVMDWIAARDDERNFKFVRWQPPSGPRVNWYAPLSLLGQLSHRDDVREIREFINIELEPQN